MAETKTFTVVATQRGYLRTIREVGDQFSVTASQFSKNWMEKAKANSAPKAEAEE